MNDVFVFNLNNSKKLLTHLFNSMYTVYALNVPGNGVRLPWLERFGVLYVLTLDLIENALCGYFYVYPWKTGPYVCLGNAEIELQCSQGKEDTKLDWNVYTSKPKSPRKYQPRVLDKNVCLVAITSTSQK